MFTINLLQKRWIGAFLKTSVRGETMKRETLIPTPKQSMPYWLEKPFYVFHLFSIYDLIIQLFQINSIKQNE